MRNSPPKPLWFGYECVNDKKQRNWPIFGSLAVLRCLWRAVWALYCGLCQVWTRSELNHLTAKIKKAKNPPVIATSGYASKQLQVKCNYGSKGDNYCAADLKQYLNDLLSTKNPETT